MAGNENSGRNPAFPLTEKELAEKFEQYKLDLQEGKFARASWPHFVSYIGCLEDELFQFIQQYSDEPKSAYYRRARALRGVSQYIRGQTCSAKEWNGQMTAFAKLLLGQDIGDGITYKDKEGNTGPVVVNVLMGGNDPRAKEAAK